MIYISAFEFPTSAAGGALGVCWEFCWIVFGIFGLLLVEGTEETGLEVEFGEFDGEFGDGQYGYGYG